MTVANEIIKICHECEVGTEKSENRRFALRGLLSDDKWRAHSGFFYPILTRIMEFLSCSPLNTIFLYFKKALRSSWIS